MYWIPFLTLRILVERRAVLIAENLVLRQQLAVLRRSVKRPRVKPRDRIFWALMSQLWRGWRSALIIVQPATVVRWHRQGFKLYWRWKSRGEPGRPAVAREIRDLIRRMSKTNPLWGAPRIHGELLKVGVDVSEATVAKYMVHIRKPPSSTWRAFLDNHVRDLVSVDFFTVPTATFRVLFAFVVLSHDRRRVVHFNVTESPSAGWTALQMKQAVAFSEPDHGPRYLLRDRDGIYGSEFSRAAETLGIEEVLSAARSPWQNPFCERVIGSIRRECLDHVIVLNEEHLRRILRSYFAYYHESRTHLSLDKDCPVPRAIEPPRMGDVVAFPQVGGLYHRYARRAA